MKRKYFLLIPCLFLGALFIKDFYLRQVRATSSWYAAFTYNNKTYAFSHARRSTNWIGAICNCGGNCNSRHPPGSEESPECDNCYKSYCRGENPAPIGNGGEKGQDWCNNVLITEGEDNEYNDWFIPNFDELQAAKNYRGDEPWGNGEMLWSSSMSSIHFDCALVMKREGSIYYPLYLPKIWTAGARCVRIISSSTPTPTVTPSASPSAPPPDFKLLLSNWSTSNPEVDLNSDGLVNGMDFGNMLKLIQ